MSTAPCLICKQKKIRARNNNESVYYSYFSIIHLIYVAVNFLIKNTQESY